MLGESISDPEGVESDIGSVEGLGWLPIETTLHPYKKLLNRSGNLWNGSAVKGYEIHAGITQQVVSESDSETAPLMSLQGEDAGIITDNIMGSYLHGLFDESDALQTILAWAGLEQVESFDYQALKEKEIERIADAVESSIDWTKWSSVLTKGEDDER